MAATKIIQGDTAPFTFEIDRPNGDAFDLTDYAADFFIKRSNQDLDSAAEFHGSIGNGITVTFAVEDGVLSVIVTNAATRNLRYGRDYFWYLTLTHVPSGSTYTPARGTFLVVLEDTE